MNAVLGVVLQSLASDSSGLIESVTQVQSDLFSIGAELATPDPQAQGMCLLPESRISDLEQSIDAIEESLPPLKNFVLPGGCAASAHLHWRERYVGVPSGMSCTCRSSPESPTVRGSSCTSTG